MNDGLGKCGSKPGQEPLPPSCKQDLTLMDVECFYEGTDCFERGDMNPVMISCDGKNYWSCFGASPRHNGKGYIPPNERYDSHKRTMFRELLLSFSTSPSVYNACNAEVKLGISGTGDQVLNRLMLFSAGETDFCSMGCSLSVACFGKFGDSKYNLMAKINQVFDDVEQTRNIPSGLKESVLQKVHNSHIDEAKAWIEFFKKVLRMPWNLMCNMKPELPALLETMVKDLGKTRDLMYNDEASRGKRPLLLQAMIVKFCEKWFEMLREEGMLNITAGMLCLRSVFSVNKFFDDLSKQRRYYRHNKCLNYGLYSTQPPHSPIQATSPVL